MREQTLLIDVTSQGQISNAFLCFFSLCFAWRKTVPLTANLNWGLLIEFARVTVTHANFIKRRQLATQNVMAGCNDHFAVANPLPIYGIRCYIKKHTKKSIHSIQIGTMFLYLQWKVNEKIYRFLILLRVIMLTTL